MSTWAIVWIAIGGVIGLLVVLGIATNYSEIKRYIKIRNM